MNPLRCLIIFLSLVVFCSSAAAQGKKKLTPEEIDKATAEGVAKLQGLWMFEKGEKNEPGYWSLPEDGGLYIEGNVIYHVKKNGEMIFNGSRLEFTIDPTGNPKTIDLVRKNGKPGQKILGIYKIDGNKLTLATDTTDKEGRPGDFTVKLAAGPKRATNVQVFALKKPEGPTAKKDVKKLNQGEIDAANADMVKSLQGHWIFEKGERNGFSYWSLPEEAIYIENNLLKHVKKNGDIIFNGSACDIEVDASKSPVAIDLIRKNGAPGQKVFGIVKVEGERLIIATNTSDDTKERRPGQFTSQLTAGQERAAVVQTYKRAPK